MLTTNNTGTAHAYDLTDAIAASEADEPTLAFIHGWLLSRAYWQPVIDLLSPYYRCLSYDLRGFGESALLKSESKGHTHSSTINNAQIELPSDKIPDIGALDAKTDSGEIAEYQAIAIDVDSNNAAPSPEISSSEMLNTEMPNTYTPSQYSLAAYAQDLEALLDKLKLKTVWLVGHSLGGSIALWAAYLQSKRVKGVICVYAGGGIYIPKEFEKFRAAGQQMVKFRPGWLPAFPLLPRLFSRIMVNQPLATHWGKQRRKDFVHAERAAAVGALLEPTTRSEVHLLPQIVGHLTPPVHFITATEDTIMPPRYVRHLASFHPQFQEEETVSEIANCGHMAMVEQPEAVGNIVRGIIDTARQPQ